MSLSQTGGFELRCQSPTVLILLLPKPYKYPYFLSISFCLHCPTQAQQTWAHSSLKHPNAFAAFTAGWLSHFLAIHVLIIVSEHRERSRGCFAHSSLSSHQFLNDYNNKLNSGKFQLKSLSHQLFKLGHQSCLYFLSSSLWCWIFCWFFFFLICLLCL